MELEEYYKLQDEIALLSNERYAVTLGKSFNFPGKYYIVVEDCKREEYIKNENRLYTKHFNFDEIKTYVEKVKNFLEIINYSQDEDSDDEEFNEF